MLTALSLHARAHLSVEARRHPHCATQCQSLECSNTEVRPDARNLPQVQVDAVEPPQQRISVWRKPPAKFER